MIDRQNAKLNMLHLLLLKLKEFLDVFKHVPAFMNAYNELTATVGDIEVAIAGQSKTAVESASTEKRKVIEELMDECIKTANCIYAFAVAESHPELLPKVAINKSMLLHGQGNDTLDIARRVLTAARNLQNEIADYGVTPEIIDELQMAIDRYDAVIVKPRSVIADIKHSTSDLTRLFANANTILNDRMDKMMVLFKTSAPDFYDVYFNSRNIINNSSRKRRTSEDNSENREE